MDEQQQQEVVEVVSYEDVRSIARDAANDALVADGFADDAALQDVANLAAEKAVQDAQDTITDAVESQSKEIATEAADKAAEKAAGNVSEDYTEKIDAAISELRTINETQAETLATIDVEQWQELGDYMRAAVWSNLLVAIMVGVLTGVMLWHSIVGRR